MFFINTLFKKNQLRFISLIGFDYCYIKRPVSLFVPVYFFCFTVLLLFRSVRTICAILCEFPLFSYIYFYLNSVTHNLYYISFIFILMLLFLFVFFQCNLQNNFIQLNLYCNAYSAVYFTVTYYAVLFLIKHNII